MHFGCITLYRVGHIVKKIHNFNSHERLWGRANWQKLSFGHLKSINILILCRLECEFFSCDFQIWNFKNKNLCDIQAMILATFIESKIVFLGLLCRMVQGAASAVADKIQGSCIFSIFVDCLEMMTGKCMRRPHSARPGSKIITQPSLECCLMVYGSTKDASEGLGFFILRTENPSPS